MQRRKFCQAALGAALVTTQPFSWVSAAGAQSAITAATLDGGTVALQPAEVRELAGALQGELLMAADPQYDVARRIWNGMHDKHPALIVQPATAADISNAVRFAGEHKLLVAVRGGGHSWPGKSVCEGGLMIDLASLRGVEVDTQRQRALVLGGSLLGQMDTATLEQGLVTTAGVVSHTGVGGFTLGGGFGRLNRKYGLAIDNLLGAQVVTADGSVHEVSADNEPDLFWALRGGGGNFGVVSRFDFQLHPFDRNVLSGPIFWPIEQAREVLTFYSEWYLGLSDDCYVGPTMATTPEGDSFIMMEVVYAGDPAKGEKELAPLLNLGKPMDNGVKVQDYQFMQTWEDATFHHGIRSYAKNGMVRAVTPELVDAMLESFVPDPRLAFFTHTAGGAVKRVGELDTAFPHRNAETMVIVAGAWNDPADDAEAMATCRNWFKQLAPFTGGYYDNIEFEQPSVAGNYGPAYPRLAKIKAQYDPANLFRLNSNILPAA